MIPKVTAFPEITALWALMASDDDRVATELTTMTQPELALYRNQLRELARRVDAQIHAQWRATESTITITSKTQTEGPPSCRRPHTTD